MIAEAMTTARAYTDQSVASLRRFILWCSVCTAIFGALVKLYLPSAAGSGAAPAASNSQSVNVGSAAEPPPQRDWLTTAEVAERERVAPRTVQGWILSGELTADRDGREYRIPRDYSRPPQSAANNR